MQSVQSVHDGEMEAGPILGTTVQVTQDSPTSTTVQVPQVSPTSITEISVLNTEEFSTPLRDDFSKPPPPLNQVRQKLDKEGFPIKVGNFPNPQLTFGDFGPFDQNFPKLKSSPSALQKKSKK